MCTMCMPGACGGHKALDLLILELLRAVNCLMGSRNQTQVLCENRCSYLQLLSYTMPVPSWIIFTLEYKAIEFDAQRSSLPKTILITPWPFFPPVPPHVNILLTILLNSYTSRCSVEFVGSVDHLI